MGSLHKRNKLTVSRKKTLFGMTYISSFAVPCCQEKPSSPTCCASGNAMGKEQQHGQSEDILHCTGKGKWQKEAVALPCCLPSPGWLTQHWVEEEKNQPRLLLPHFNITL